MTSTPGGMHQQSVDVADHLLDPASGSVARSNKWNRVAFDKTPGRRLAGRALSSQVRADPEIAFPVELGANGTAWSRGRARPQGGGSTTEP